MVLEVAGFTIVDDGLLGMGLVRAIVAEIIGTAFLVYLGCGGVAGACLANGDATTAAAKVLYLSLAFGIGIGAVVHMFSDISGGQLNPAVSFGLFFARKLSLIKTLIFSVCQIVGGIVGAGVLKISIPGNLTAEIAGEGVFPGTVAVHEDLSAGQGFLYEFMGTLILVITVLATTNGGRGHGSNYLQPLSIGLAIFVIHLVVAPFTGSGINPARSLASNIFSESGISGDFFVYIFGPLLASLVGGLLYEFFFSPHYNKAHHKLNGQEMDDI